MSNIKTGLLESIYEAIQSGEMGPKAKQHPLVRAYQALSEKGILDTPVSSTSIVPSFNGSYMSYEDVLSQQQTMAAAAAMKGPKILPNAEIIGNPSPEQLAAIPNPTRL